MKKMVSTHIRLITNKIQTTHSSTFYSFVTTNQRGWSSCALLKSKAYSGLYDVFQLGCFLKKFKQFLDIEKLVSYQN
jgi:hypothetical protein